MRRGPGVASLAGAELEFEASGSSSSLGEPARASRSDARKERGGGRSVSEVVKKEVNESQVQTSAYQARQLS